MSLILTSGYLINVAAQVPPATPTEDFPKPMPPEGKKAKKNPAEVFDMPKPKGVKPPLPVMPPTPEPTAPDEPEL